MVNKSNHAIQNPCIVTHINCDNSILYSYGRDIAQGVVAVFSPSTSEGSELM
jgi:hypothetical protein